MRDVFKRCIEFLFFDAVRDGCFFDTTKNKHREWYTFRVLEKATTVYVVRVTTVLVLDLGHDFGQLIH